MKVKQKSAKNEIRFRVSIEKNFCSLCESLWFNENGNNNTKRRITKREDLFKISFLQNNKTETRIVQTIVQPIGLQ